MDISLTKLPWYGADRRVRRCSAAARRGVVLLLLRDADARRDGDARGAARRRCGATSPRARRPRRSCPSSSAQVDDLEARLANLGGAARREGRRRPAAAHADGGDAVEPHDQGLQAGAGRHEGAARRVADQPRARRHVPQPRDSSSIASASSPASSTSAGCRSRARTSREPNATIAATLRGDDVRAARQAGCGAAQAGRQGKAQLAKKAA